jgi:hypothetical protein
VARALLAAALSAALVPALAVPAKGETNMEAARVDYEAGAAAYDRKDYATAATYFNRADERVPNPRALQLAMASCLHLSDAALAMNLVERAESRAVDGSLAELAKRLRQKFGGDAGRVRVTCPFDDRQCRASIDGNNFDPGIARWVSPGTHHVVVRSDSGGAIESDVHISAGSTTTVALPATQLANPAAAPPPSEAPAHVTTKETERAGISPIFFWSGVVLTGAAATTATFLTFESSDRHDAFLASRSAETAAAGEAAQTRAAVGWVVTGGLLITTVVIAILTDFRGKSARASTGALRFGGPLP